MDALHNVRLLGNDAIPPLGSCAYLVSLLQYASLGGAYVASIHHHFCVVDQLSRRARMGGLSGWHGCQ